jgi:hypothetical protein
MDFVIVRNSASTPMIIVLRGTSRQASTHHQGSHVFFATMTQRKMRMPQDFNASAELSGHLAGVNSAPPRQSPMGSFPQSLGFGCKVKGFSLLLRRKRRFSSAPSAVIVRG